MAPAVSVIVPSFQGAARLPVLLEALRCQMTPRLWEVVVVLDGSTDASTAVLERVGEGTPLRVLSLEQNRGPAVALNVGFREARGQILIRCDDDLRPGPRYVERHASWHDKATDTAVIGLTRNKYGPGRFGAVYGRQADQLQRAQAYATPEARRWIHWAANCSVRRELWDRIGPYDESFRRGQDSEWGGRLFRAGARIVIDPQLEVDHLKPATNATCRLAQAFESGKTVARRDRRHGSAQQETDSGVKARVWAALVSAGGRWCSAGGLRDIGHGIDKLLPFLPSRLAYLLIAWGVDSAARAGDRAARRG